MYSSGSLRSSWTFTAAIAAGSSSSQRASGIPSWTASVTVATAPSRSSKTQRAAAISSGMPWMRNVSSVMIASVPSEPSSSRVRS